MFRVVPISLAVLCPIEFILTILFFPVRATTQISSLLISILWLGGNLILLRS